MVEVPVFLINGFLESGKTTLIKDIINQDSKLQKLDTLLIVCEQARLNTSNLSLKKIILILFILKMNLNLQSIFSINLIRILSPQE